MSDTRTYAEKRKAIRMKERLIELLAYANEQADEMCEHNCDVCRYDQSGHNCPDVRIAEVLVANGVTVTIKKPPTDLSGKCGSCAYAKVEPKKFVGLNCYVRCTNPEHLAKYCRGIDRSLRQRTNPACKNYKPKEGA